MTKNRELIVVSVYWLYSEFDSTYELNTLKP